MMKPSLLSLSFAALATLALAACTVPAGNAAESDTADLGAAATSTTAPASIVFDTEWNETLHGSLLDGSSFAIDYNPARLPQCRASHNGNPAWNITASARFSPSGTVTNANIMDHTASASGSPDYYSWVKTLPVIAIPAGTTQVELWFNNTSGADSPCSTWDSNFAKNYIFSVGSAEAKGSYSFQSDWNNVTSGKIAQGGQLTINYDTSRLVSKLQPFGGPGWVCREINAALHMNYRFSPNAPFQGVSLANVSERGPFIGVTSTMLTIPKDASRFEAYFDADLGYTYWDCSGSTPVPGSPPPPTPVKSHTSNRYFDSNYGSNYVYNIP